jgi:hypothetical protein
MITEHGFIDTAETLEINEADDSAYTQLGDDLQQDAKALLATVRHLMSGYEMQVCEAAAEIDDADEIDVDVITRLRNQFVREIAAWKDGVTA